MNSPNNNLYGSLETFTREAGDLIQEGRDQNNPHETLRNVHASWMKNIDPVTPADPDLDPDHVSAYLRKWYRNGRQRDVLVHQEIDFLRERFGAIDRDGSLESQSLKTTLALRIAAVAEAARMIMKGVRDDPSIQNIRKTETITETLRWVQRKREPGKTKIALEMILQQGTLAAKRLGVAVASTAPFAGTLKGLLDDVSSTLLATNFLHRDEKTGMVAKGECMASAIYHNTEPESITINGREFSYSFKKNGIKALSMDGASILDTMPSTATTALITHFLATADDPREGPNDPPIPSKIPVVNILSWMRQK